MRVILDTNIFIAAQYSLDTPDFRVFLGELARTGHTLYVSQIVYDELISKFSESVAEYSKNCENNAKMLSKLIGQPLESIYVKPDLNSTVQAFAGSLRLRLKLVNAKFLSYPAVQHKLILARALSRKRPFDSKGHNGYRDTLIWHDVLKIAKYTDNQAVAFISANLSDFGNLSKPTELHPQLAEELELSGTSIAKILYFRSLEEFINKYINPALGRVQEIQQQIEQGRYKTLEIEKFSYSIMQEILSAFSHRKLKRILRFPAAAKFVTYNEITAIYDMKIKSVRLLSTGDVAVEYTLLCDADMSFESSTPSKLPSLLALSLDEAMSSSALVSIEIFAAIHFILNPTNGEVSSWQIRELSTNHQDYEL